VKKRLTQCCLCLAACLAFHGCLVPDKYIATLSLSNIGYSLDFIGKMHMAASYSATYQQGMDNPRQLAVSIMSEFERVIKERPQGTVETMLLDEHSFGTKFVYVSPYYLAEATGMFAFTLNEGGDTLTVISRPISTKDTELLKQNNVTSKGTLCIKAFGTVLESNADKRATLIDMCHRWELEDLERPIKLVVRFPHPVPMTPKAYQDAQNTPKSTRMR
jgi:hypothetical protein